ncbi:pyrroline-5-carboxylate reductase [Dermatophilaceae bacterium Soc4.6]
MTTSTSTTAIFGAGVMGETLLSGLLRSGRPADELVITERRPDHAAMLQERYGVRVLDNADAADAATVLVLVVKPQDMDGLLAEVHDRVRPGDLVVSLAAGITTAFLEERLPEGSSVVRVMPNTPALVDQGMAAISPGRHCTPEHLAQARALLESCGRVVEVVEKHQDAVTAISGSGPAYIFYVVEAMVEAGVVLGLPRATASELVVQTLFGAATMLKETGEHPTVLRERVSSPGGTTVAALRQLDDHRVRAAFIDAIEAASRRSHELASGIG